ATWWRSSSRRSAVSASGCAGITRPSASAARSASEAAIGGLEVGRLAEAAAAARDPVGDPAEERLEADLGRTEERHAPGRVAEEGRAGLAGEADVASEQAAEALGGDADRDDFRARRDERHGRVRSEGERAERVGVGVALPDGVDVRRPQVDGLP